MPEHNTNSPDGLKITNVMIYAKLMEVNENQIAMRVELNQMADHEARLRFLERKLWIIVGASGVLGGIITTVITKALG